MNHLVLGLEPASKRFPALYRKTPVGSRKFNKALLYRGGAIPVTLATGGNVWAELRDLRARPCDEDFRGRTCRPRMTARSHRKRAAITGTGTLRLRALPPSRTCELRELKGKRLPWEPLPSPPKTSVATPQTHVREARTRYPARASAAKIHTGSSCREKRPAWRR